MKVLVIPDVHLKPWMFDKADELLKAGKADRAVCLMDLPDNFGQANNIGLYLDTFKRAILFHGDHPDTLWCYGNHDLSYLWNQGESGFSIVAAPVVKRCVQKMQDVIPADNLAYIHRIDKVLFLHGGLTDIYVRKHIGDIDYYDTDAVISAINQLGARSMWQDSSPIWFRPQSTFEIMYDQSNILQVVGHTPVERISKEWNVISCDVFSTYQSGKPIGTQEFLVIDTETWKYTGIKAV